MSTPDLPDKTLALRIRAEAAALRLRAVFGRLRAKAGFDPNQPRVPAGNPDGGQWTDAGSDRPSSAQARADNYAPARAEAKPARTQTRVVHDRSGEMPWTSYTESRRQSDGMVVSRTVTNRDGSKIVSATGASSGAERNEVTVRDGSRFTFETRGDVQRILDGKGRLLSESTWSPSGVQTRPVMTPAFIDLNSASRLLESGATLFNWLSSLKESGAFAAAVFNATEFLNRGDKKRLEAEWIGKRTEAEIEQLCKRFGLVRELTDRAAASSPRTAYRSAAARGTAIHLKVKQRVDGFRDQNFRAELSLLKASEDAGAKIRDYGLKDTIRIDVLERLGSLVCVYDLKTGRRRLSAPRIREIARNVFSVYPEAQQMLIVEVRPSD